MQGPERRGHGRPPPPPPEHLPLHSSIKLRTHPPTHQPQTPRSRKYSGIHLVMHAHRHALLQTIQKYTEFRIQPKADDNSRQPTQERLGRVWVQCRGLPSLRRRGKNAKMGKKLLAGKWLPADRMNTEVIAKHWKKDRRNSGRVPAIGSGPRGHRPAVGG